MRPDRSHIIITVDVEDWFQVENFKTLIPYSNWSSFDLRVGKNVHRIMDLFDSASQRFMNGRTLRATFFVLGWVAERLPNLIREIHSRGHEVGSHGYLHALCDKQNPKNLSEDLIKSKALLEDVSGEPVWGFRAPSFSINRAILDLIRKAGYRYDSSYNSFQLHGRYGRVDFSDTKKTGAAISISNGFKELPVSNLTLGNITMPWAGGAYFRLIPFEMFKWGVRRILNRQNAFVFYMHPWEIDPDQPRVKEASRSVKFKHYTGLGKTKVRLEALVEKFQESDFVTCNQYLDLM